MQHKVVIGRRSAPGGSLASALPGRAGALVMCRSARPGEAMGGEREARHCGGAAAERFTSFKLTGWKIKIPPSLLPLRSRQRTVPSLSLSPSLALPLSEGRTRPISVMERAAPPPSPPISSGGRGLLLLEVRSCSVFVSGRPEGQPARD